nr:isoform 2 of protein phyllo, chloroplastic [Quercus suber]
MKSQLSHPHPHTLSPSLSNHHFRTKRSLLPLQTLTFLTHNSFLRLSPQNPNPVAVEAVRFDGPVVEIGESSEVVDGDLAFETCITRTLPPALTLEHGLQSIKEAVEKLKLDPPSSASGVLRFQVAVPPGPKALNWFCCQPELSVYPLFFLSKNTDNPTYKSLFLNGSRGVFGIGAAIYFTNSSSCTSRERNLTKRYLSTDSTFIMIYGFMDINFNIASSKMNEAGSYLFIPQIELDEYEGVSFLAATLAWNNSSLCSFEEAVRSYEFSLKQASCHSWLTTDKCHSESIRSNLGKLKVVEDKTVTMVYMNLLSKDGREVMDGIMELKEGPSSYQFCIRLSPTITIARNMIVQVVCLFVLSVGSYK